jgi:2,3-bisphosphoglycerate-independent phosphoglycerate mutase
MKIIFFFIDGLGLGQDDGSNPFSFIPTPNLSAILDGQKLVAASAGRAYTSSILLALDATLGVSGLPQSATGQASLFTGKNVARLVGRHVNGLPTPQIRKILSCCGIFQKLMKRGYSCAFLNGYRPLFFHNLESGNFRRFSCSTFLNYYAGLPFRSLEDVRLGKAVYADITNHLLVEQGFEIPLISPREAARRLVALSRKYDLVLFEHFGSDLAGHRVQRELSREAVTLLDDFLGGLLDYLPVQDTLLFISSDHGNLEYFPSKVHTANPVPALFFGRIQPALLKGLHDITGVVPALIRILDSYHRSV